MGIRECPWKLRLWKNVDSTNKKDESWNVVSARKSPTKKVVSPRQKSAGVRQNASNIVTSSNVFEALEAVEDDQLVSTVLKDDIMN